jgi:WD40 repeat protein
MAGILIFVIIPDIKTHNQERNLKFSANYKILPSLVLSSGHTEGITALSVSPDCRFMLSGSKDKTIILWDVSSGKQIHTFRGHSGEIMYLRFADSKGKIFSGSSDETVKIWDLKSGNEVVSLSSVDSTDWIVSTPSGLFDASPGALKYIRFVKGTQIFNLSDLKYQNRLIPGLLSRTMENN